MSRDEITSSPSEPVEGSEPSIRTLPLPLPPSPSPSDREMDGTTQWADLPFHIMGNTLHLLPLETLREFRDMHPGYGSVISSPQFAKTWNLLASKPQRALLATNCSGALRFINLADANRTPKELDPFLPEERGERYWYSPPCNGLLLRHSKNYEAIFLFNPFTTAYNELPETPDDFKIKSPEGFEQSACGFGCDSKNEDFKVVIVRNVGKNEGHTVEIVQKAVYSLKTNKWSVTEVSESLVLDNEFGVYFNDSLHWINRKSKPADIAALNISDKSDGMFRSIELPQYGDGNEYLVVIQGFLSLFIHPPNGSGIDVWMMKTYGETETWKKFTVDNPMKIIPRKFFFFVQDWYVSRTSVGGTEVAGESDRHQLVLYNPKTETVEVIIIPGPPITYAYSFLGILVENLVSPHHEG